MNDETQPVVTTNALRGVNRDGDVEIVELELHLECPNWAVAQYKAVYTHSRDLWRLRAMFFDGRN